jgi:hypothetical protein
MFPGWLYSLGWFGHCKHLEDINVLQKLKTLFLRSSSSRPVAERRRVAPVGTQPVAGKYIAKQKFLIRVSEPMSFELWEWLAEMNWREIQMATNKRQYYRLPDNTLTKLALASRAELETVYKEIIKATIRKNNLKLH